MVPTAATGGFPYPHCKVSDWHRPARPNSIAGSWVSRIDIRKMVAREFRISERQMLSRKKDRGTVWPRMVSMYLARIYTPCSLLQIAQANGAADHTTVLHATWRVPEIMAKDSEIRARVTALRASLTAANMKAAQGALQ